MMFVFLLIKESFMNFEDLYLIFDDYFDVFVEVVFFLIVLCFC